MHDAEEEVEEEEEVDQDEQNRSEFIFSLAISISDSQCVLLGRFLGSFLHSVSSQGTVDGLVQSC